MRDFWFADLTPGATAPNKDVMMKWYGAGSQEQKEAFDHECKENFVHALDSLSPSKLALPAFQSYEDDIKNADTLSAPLLAEVHDAGEDKAADTLLGLILLLDQMARNIYRDPAGLRLVFNHYDRLALALFYSSTKISPSPLDHPTYRLRPVIKTWYLMPLIHAEHLPSHELFKEYVKGWQKEVGDAGDQEAASYCGDSLKYGYESHNEPLRRFGRYPHRNAAIGRESTQEEKEFLKGAEAFGVTQNGEKEEEKSKDEL